MVFIKKRNGTAVCKIAAILFKPQCVKEFHKYSTSNELCTVLSPFVLCCVFTGRFYPWPSCPLLAPGWHYSDVMISAMASQITSASIVCSTVCSVADQRKHQSSASLALCQGNPPVAGGFPSQRASNAEIVSIWWRHHDLMPVKQSQTTSEQSYWWVNGSHGSDSITIA